MAWPDRDCFMDADEAKAAIVEIGRRMYSRGFVAANDGNISVRVGEDKLVITPAGVSKGYMDADMLVLTDMRGNALDRRKKPSSELGLHIMAYARNPEIKSVCHAHPPAATAYAVLGYRPDLDKIAEYEISLGRLAFAKYAAPGTAEAAEAIKECCLTHNAALLERHGAVAWGTDPYEAYFKIETLEHCCKIAAYADGVRHGMKTMMRGF